MTHRLFFIACCVTVSIFGQPETTQGQSRPTAEYQLKAVFLYNFTRFIEWPAMAFESYNDPFIITILGNDPFGDFLERTVIGEKIGRHPIEIKRINNINQLDRCHILFINLKDPQTTRNVLSEIRNRSILTVSDIANFASMGGMIGFVTENNKIRMQINSNVAKNAELNISSKLLRVSKVL